MDKAFFPVGFKMINQKMMDNPIPEVSCKNFPAFGFFHQEGHAAGRGIGSAVQFISELDEIGFQVSFKTQTVDGAAFPAAATFKCPVEIFQGKKRMFSFPKLERGNKRMLICRIQIKKPGKSSYLFSASHRPHIVGIRLIGVVHVAVVEVHVPYVLRVVGVTGR